MPGNIGTKIGSAKIKQKKERSLLLSRNFFFGADSSWPRTLYPKF